MKKKKDFDINNKGVVASDNLKVIISLINFCLIQLLHILTVLDLAMDLEVDEAIWNGRIPIVVSIAHEAHARQDETPTPFYVSFVLVKGR